MDTHNGFPVFRIDPALPVQAMQTFGLRSPLDTHHRRVSCAEGACPTYVNGWRTRIDETTTLGKDQATYIRVSSGRAFVESRDETGLTVFDFEAGQRDFAGNDAHEHYLALEREPLYVVRGGDWRGATTPTRRHANGDDWVDQFAGHQDELATRLAEG